MRPRETLPLLAQFHRRGAATDAERRAAVALRDELTTAGWDAHLDTFWCRPNRAMAHAWHAALALTGSLVAIGHARLGGALVLVALLCVLADELTGRSPGRLLTRLRATQNLVARPAAADEGEAADEAEAEAEPAVPPSARLLLVVAQLDVERESLSARLLRRRLPHPLGWFALTLVLLLIGTLLRAQTDGVGVRIVQLIPSALLVLTLGGLLEHGSSSFPEGSPDADAGVAIALALGGALAAARLPGTTVELLLEGAGRHQGIGLRHHLRARPRHHLRAHRNAPDTVVLAVSPGTGPTPSFFATQGALGPLPASRRLVDRCREIARAEPDLGVVELHGREASPAQPAQLARIPAITIAAGGQDSECARNPADLDATVELGLLLADSLQLRPA